MTYRKQLTALPLGIALGLGAALGLSATAASAAETLVISSWAPPSHGMNAKMWPRLIKMIEKATDGRVTAKIKYKLASPPAQFDLIRDGAADMTWIFHGYSPGKFVGTKLIELPGYTGNAEAASVAYWRVYEKYLKSLNEHKGVKVIALHTHGPGQLQTNRKVATLADIKGMKLRLGGGVSGAVGKKLGAKGIRVPAPKVYETLASKAADGVMMPMEGRKGFKLTEVAKNVFIMPGGFYRGSFALIMNSAKFKSLSAADQKALQGVFGEAASKMAGAVWDEIDAIGLAATKAASDNTITTASAADQASYAKMAGEIRADVFAELKKKGVDAAAAHDFVTKQMAGYGK